MRKRRGRVETERQTKRRKEKRSREIASRRPISYLLQICGRPLVSVDCVARIHRSSALLRSSSSSAAAPKKKTPEKKIVYEFVFSRVTFERSRRGEGGEGGRRPFFWNYLWSRSSVEPAILPASLPGVIADCWECWLGSPACLLLEVCLCVIFCIYFGS